MTKMAKIDILFMTKTAKKTLPFGAAHTYIAREWNLCSQIPPV